MMVSTDVLLQLKVRRRALGKRDSATTRSTVDPLILSRKKGVSALSPVKYAIFAEITETLVLEI
jgi:hypothetical protein